MRDINKSTINIINIEEEDIKKGKDNDDRSGYDRILNDSVEVTKERKSIENGTLPTFGRGFEAFGDIKVTEDD